MELSRRFEDFDLQGPMGAAIGQREVDTMIRLANADARALTRERLIFVTPLISPDAGG